MVLLDNQCVDRTVFCLVEATFNTLKIRRQRWNHEKCLCIAETLNILCMQWCKICLNITSCCLIGREMLEYKVAGMFAYGVLIKLSVQTNLGPCRAMSGHVTGSLLDETANSPLYTHICIVRYVWVDFVDLSPQEMSYWVALLIAIQS